MPEFLDPQQAAEYLGETRNTVYRLIGEGRISYHKAGATGGRYKFTQDQLDAYLDSIRVEPQGAPAPKPGRTPRPKPFVPDGRHRIRVPGSG